MKSITILFDGDCCPNCSDLDKPKPLNRVPLCDVFHQCICLDCQNLLTINPSGVLNLYDQEFIKTVTDLTDRFRIRRRHRFLMMQMTEINIHLRNAKKLIYG